MNNNNNNNEDPFIQSLETLINKMEKIKSDFENCEEADTNWLGLMSDTSSALEDFLNDVKKK